MRSAEPVWDQSPARLLPCPSPCPSWWWYGWEPTVMAITLPACTRPPGCTETTVPGILTAGLPRWPVASRDPARRPGGERPARADRLPGREYRIHLLIDSELCPICPGQP